MLSGFMKSAISAYARSRATSQLLGGIRYATGAAIQHDPVFEDVYLNTPREKCSRDEWAVREDLTACYHLAKHFGFDDIMWNHITARVPGTETFLINRFGQRYDEVTPESLVRLDVDGNIVGNDGSVVERPHEDTVNYTGYVIHSAIHKARPDVGCVFHSHPVAGTAVASMNCGFLYLQQDCGKFYNDVAYHSYHGMSLDCAEQDIIVRSLGTKNVLVMKHHGITTLGRGVSDAFDRMFYFNKCCEIQLEVMKSGQGWEEIPDDQMKYLASQYDTFPVGKYEWPALRRLADTLPMGHNA